MTAPPEFVWEATSQDVMVPGSQGAWVLFACLFVFYAAVLLMPRRQVLRPVPLPMPPCSGGAGRSNPEGGES